MSDYFSYELAKASMNLATDLLGLKKGESVVITADTQSDFRVVDAIAAAVFTVGAKPMVITTASPLGVGKAADPMLPMEPLTAALSNADAWVELNQQWLLYSTAYERAMKANHRLRHMNMVGMTVDMVVRLLGWVDNLLLAKFLHQITDMTQAAKEMRITTPAGNDLSYKTIQERAVLCEDGLTLVPGSHYLTGQICWFPDLPSIHGKLVFDGSITPGAGLVDKPVILHIEAGRVVSIHGGQKADEYRTWLDPFDDPNMFRLGHCRYGFHPWAKLTGNVIEDERVRGCTEWGLGYMPAHDIPPDGINAKSHTDGICLNSSVWLDDDLLLENGVVVHPDLKAMAEELLRK